MKRFVLALLGLVLALSLTTASYAAVADFDPNFFTADSTGAYKGVFNLDETPYLSITLPYSGLSFTSYWWTDPTSKPLFSYTLPTTSNHDLFPLSNVTFFDGAISKSWGEIVKTGDWNVAATYAYPGQGESLSGRYEANFKVVPEPVSAGLFILGGAALAIIRRKKA